MTEHSWDMVQWLLRPMSISSIHAKAIETSDMLDGNLEIVNSMLIVSHISLLKNYIRNIRY